VNNFLFQVAKYLIDSKSQSFDKMELVFPNRRSGVYFLKYFKELTLEPLWLPRIKTINEFVQDFSTVRLAEPIELLADLYRVFVKVSRSSESFDDFFHWGEMMLNDFDDIDKYLVEPKGLFSNIEELKKFDRDLDFLTEDQLTVIRNFFIAFNPDLRSELKDKFLEIWSILFPVYEQFQASLKDKGIGYEGMVYRESVSKIQQLGSGEFNFDQVYFIGFNAITRCEEEIFDYLKRINLAGFFWDYDDYYIKNQEQEAGLFLRKYLQKFPAPEWGYQASSLKEVTKKIKLVSASTNHGQVYYASEILQNLKVHDFSKTALVLSDEQLLLPVLNYLPKGIDEINITMGYPVKDSLAGNLIDLLINLQINRRGLDTTNVSFSHQQVIPLLRHPYLNAISTFDLSKKIDQLIEGNLFYIPKEYLAWEPILELIFKPVNNSIFFIQYLKDILVSLQEKLSEKLSESAHFLIDLEFLYQIYLTFDRFSKQFENLGLELALTTFARLLRKVVQSVKVPFEGEPVKGLQIMGFLETRNLDFDQVIILSVNEGKLPSSGNMPSFIPYSLRKGFGMPTREMHDAMYAYYFYRLIQRASSVYLVYNSGSSGMNTGEKSRFAYQMVYNPEFTVDFENIPQTIQVMVDEPVTIQKSGKVRERLLEYLNPDLGKKLSPSAITTYLTCPLRFYYRSVLYLNESQDIDDTVDSRMFGNIFHLAAQKLYQPFYDAQTLVTEAELLRLQNQPNGMHEILEQAFNSAFLGENSYRQFTIQGKNLLVHDVIKKYLLQLIEVDKQRTPFSVVGLERKLEKKVAFQSNGNAYQINIGGQIDRIDRTNNTLQIIDYKTGADKLTFKLLENLFDSATVSDFKAVLQTFIYSWVGSSNYPDEQVIVPLVYQVKRFFESEKSFEVDSKEEVRFVDGNFKTIEEPFNQLLIQLLTEIFDWSVPFTQTEDASRCVHCPYRLMCRK